MSKRKKVQIYTLNGYGNYGNRLQLFALSVILGKYNVSLSVYWPKKLYKKAKNAIKYFFPPFSLRSGKEHKVHRFTSRFIPKSSNKAKYDLAISGSDQVWNPDFLRRYPYLLRIPGRNKKISYAASIGKEELTDEEKEIFRNALKSYSMISVREESARKILQPLTCQKIEVVLDPTLLIDVRVYRKIEKCPKAMVGGRKYILCYILGNSDYLDAIKDYARKTGCDVIYFSDRRDSNYGIEEFLYLIHHAELVCTDSFHASVLSFLYEKPFIIFRRTGELDYMYSRLRNLIELFKLNNREYNGKAITEDNLRADYSRAKMILKTEREKSLGFIERALNDKNEN